MGRVVLTILSVMWRIFRVVLGVLLAGVIISNLFTYEGPSRPGTDFGEGEVAGYFAASALFLMGSIWMILGAFRTGKRKEPANASAT